MHKIVRALMFAAVVGATAISSVPAQRLETLTDSAKQERWAKLDRKTVPVPIEIRGTAPGSTQRFGFARRTTLTSGTWRTAYRGI